MIRRKSTNKKKSSKKQAISSKISDKAKAVVKPDQEPVPGEESVNITNKTVAEHREEVLSGARKFIYPLQHSKHRIAIISSIIIVLVIVGLTVYSTLLLYRYKSTGDFAFRVTQVLPFPVARVDGNFVSYEDYLFEVRHTFHYYRTQENIDFSDEEGQAIDAEVRQQALEKVINDKLTEKLAAENDITVTSEEIQAQIDLLRVQGGFGDGDRALEDVLRDFYDWSIGDLEEVVRQQLLRQKLIPIIDTDTRARAEGALRRLESGEAYDVVVEVSDDEGSKVRGGELGFITRTNTDLPPNFVETAFTLEEGQTSAIIQTDAGFHILKNLESTDDGQVRIAHIFFRFLNFDEYLNEQKETLAVSRYISFD